MTEASTNTGDGERRRVADEIAARLRRRGVRLAGTETGDQLATLLEAVERFESAVERGGGDLMVDEPVRPGGAVSPDDRAFALPTRHEKESVAAYLDRIAEATTRARQVRGRR